MKPGLTSPLHFFSFDIILDSVEVTIGYDIGTVLCWWPMLCKKSVSISPAGFLRVWYFCKAQMFAHSDAPLPWNWEIKFPLEHAHPSWPTASAEKSPCSAMVVSCRKYFESRTIWNLMQTATATATRTSSSALTLHVHTCFSHRLQTENNLKWLVSKNFEERKPRRLIFRILFQLEINAFFMCSSRSDIHQSPSNRSTWMGVVKPGISGAKNVRNVKRSWGVIYMPYRDTKIIAIDTLTALL